MKQGPATRSTAADSSEAVDAFMSTLDHPCKPEIEALRKIIRGAHPSIAEGIKWNAPSFRTTEYFATTHLRAKTGIGVILHLGAKARALPAGGLPIQDPEKLLQWLAKDRAMVTFSDVKDVRARKAALEAIVRQWISHL
jgi:hypothetical protein